MFTIENFTTKALPIYIVNTTIVVDFQLKLVNESSIDIVNFTLRDYVDTCLHHIIVKLKEIKNNVFVDPEKITYYVIKDTDDVDGLISFNINSYVYDMSTYDVQIGYLQRNKTNDESDVMIANVTCRTCYDNGTGLNFVGQTFTNSLVEIEWTGRYNYIRLFVCYYL